MSVDAVPATTSLAECRAGSTSPPVGPPGKAQPRGRNTLVLLVFTVFTNLADGVTKIALPLMAARITDSPALISLVSLTLTLPWLLVALHVGVLVDRADRRRLLWLADGMRLLAVGALLLTVAAGGVTLWGLAVAGVVLGVAEVIALTSAAALVPAVVPRAERERANAWITGAETAANEFAGPFVGGLLVAAGTGVALGASWVTYLVASLILLLLTGRFRAVREPSRPAADRLVEHQPAPGQPAAEPPAAQHHAAQQQVADQPPVHQQIGVGLRYLWQHRLLRTTTLILTVLCASWGAWLALLPLVATRLMGLSPQEYGMVLSGLGVGGLVGAITVTWVNRLLGRRWAMFADLLGTLAMMAVPAFTTALWAVVLSAFVGGMGGTLWAVNSRLIAQNVVPDAMMGRYSGVARLFSWGALPLGAGLMGVLAEWCGVRFAFLAFAVAVAATIPVFLRGVSASELRAVE
ncbi:MFS transporter [Streptomyces zagrosensis]|uniref:MFS family permease n=1 Tax=Streptomyces zagrosensis TaxID=1042984 RepID=A0A7W9UZM5_9ACTN|nr:MFS transporter [Streptomyces zagrosensis]MBB5936902.1 MFS family permease [Streptomyces zagrosensis]